MQGKEVVVVVVPVECKQSTDGKMFASRILALGLTAYGGTLEESRKKLKIMFAAWVDLNRKSGTLELALNKSKLSWCYEKDYTDVRPYEKILPNGDIQVMRPKSDPPNHTWQEMKELVAAR
jgi:hypothetical protein